MSAPPLVAVAHGSRDPRSATTVSALVEVMRTKRPDVDIRTAFLELSAPRLGDVLEALHGQGHREVVVVPLLLGSAYHARVDIPTMVAEVTARLPRLSVPVADVLGPDSRLEAVALSRLLATGARLDDESLGVVVAAAGSSHRPVNAAVSTVARRWAARFRLAGAVAAFAAATGPQVPTAIDLLRRRGARRIAVASWFVAPGLLPDRIIGRALAADPAAMIADPLGPHPELADLVLDRYDARALVPAGRRVG
jgi:sirohydrochlorin ferrochelatase